MRVTKLILLRQKLLGILAVIVCFFAVVQRTLFGRRRYNYLFSIIRSFWRRRVLNCERVKRLRGVDAYLESALDILELDGWRRGLVLANRSSRLQRGLVQLLFRRIALLRL